MLPAGLSGTPCANTLRQQIRGVIHKSPGRPCFEATLHAGEWPSCVGSEQSAFTEGDACAGQNEPRSRHVVKEQCLFRGMDALDLQAFSVNPVCLEFGPNDSKVVLKPRLGYVPKVLSTPFRAQVLALSVFFPPTGSQESLFCSVGALRIFIEHSASYSKSEQLFVGFGNRPCYETENF